MRMETDKGTLFAFSIVSEHTRGRGRSRRRAPHGCPPHLQPGPDKMAADKEEAYDTSPAPGHDKAAAWRAARVALGSALLVPLAIGSGCEVPGGASVAKAIYYLMWSCRRA